MIYATEDCQGFVFKLLEKKAMLTAHLTQLERTLAQFVGDNSENFNGPRAEGFMRLVRLTQVSAKLALEDEVQAEEEQRSLNSSVGQGSAGISSAGSREEWLQQSNTVAHAHDSPLWMSKQKSVGCGTTGTKVGGLRLRLGRGGGDRKWFHKLMENLREIIKYQNKIPKIIQRPLAADMTEIQYHPNLDDSSPKLLPKSILFDPQPQQHSPNPQSLRAFVQECKMMETNLEEFEANTSHIRDHSHCQTNDKKSLLTEMLKVSQILSDADDLEPFQQLTPIKQNKRPTSEVGYKSAARSEKKLLKEIDFSGYKIETVKGYKRKEKTASNKNYGQCSQCSLF